MIRYIFKLVSTIILITTLCAGCKVQTAKQKPIKPNVIVIYTDDLGYGDLSCYNRASKINTPHIDKLAAQGIMFTDAHSPASFCTPSRYSTLTGRYCWRSESTSGLQGGYDTPIIEKDEMTLGHLFQKNGYKTAAIGKWHLGMMWPLKEGEDEYDEENYIDDSD